jgi:cytochrome P450
LLQQPDRRRSPFATASAKAGSSHDPTVVDGRGRNIFAYDQKENAMTDSVTQTAPERTTTAHSRATAKQRLEDLPAPRGLPLLGNLHQLDPKQLHAQLEAWGQELGSNFTFKLGPKRILVTSNVEIALSALKNRPGRFRRLSTIEPVTKEMGLNGVFSVEGEAWRPQRDLVMRALAPQQLESFFPTLQFISERLLRRWQRSANAGTDTDVLQDLTRFTVDATATLVFGKDVNTLEAGEDAIQRHLGAIFPILSYRVNAPLPYWRYFKLPKDYQLDRSLKAVRSFVEEMIAHARERMRRAPAEKPHNLLEAMLALRDEPNSGFSDDDVYANVLTLLLAGEDTTAHSLAWAMHILAGKPELQSQLHRAARNALGDARVPMTFADTAKLGLFEGVAFEAMRMRTVAPMIFLEANETTELAGIEIPAGTAVFVLTRPASLDDNNYRDAKAFTPERWIGQRDSTREGHNTRAFLHFGAGPRFCPGRYLASLEMKMVLAILSRNFSVEYAEDPETTQEVFAFAMMPSRLRLRLSSIA